jgi:hypothetical protein
MMVDNLEVRFIQNIVKFSSYICLLEVSESYWISLDIQEVSLTFLLVTLILSDSLDGWMDGCDTGSRDFRHTRASRL